MRLNSWTGIEGLPVSSLDCDRALHSGIRAPGSWWVFAVRWQMAAGWAPYRDHRSTNCARTWLGSRPELGPLDVPVGCSAYKPSS